MCLEDMGVQGAGWGSFSALSATVNSQALGVELDLLLQRVPRGTGAGGVLLGSVGDRQLLGGVFQALGVEGSQLYPCRRPCLGQTATRAMHARLASTTTTRLVTLLLSRIAFQGS